MASDNRKVFLDLLEDALSDHSFIKLTLSKPLPEADEGLRNVYLRPVMLKAGPRIAFNHRYVSRDEVKNFTYEESISRLNHLLGRSFANAQLMTTAGDAQLQMAKSGAFQLKQMPPSHSDPVPQTHNREKERLLNPSAPWLHRLGITNKRGEVLPSAQDKWKQINKYLEIMQGLLNEKGMPTDLHIADMGSGKGYLTFALYDYLANVKKWTPHVVGIELRPKLVELCNEIAQESGFSGLHFEAADIRDYAAERIDVLIALHACDTATDLALAKGIHANARVIVAAPCCHKQVRKAMHAQNEMAPLMRHGILEERQAELLTDGIRALLLESEGYQTKVFEFISTEHTAKNVMITASQMDKKHADRRDQALKKVASLKEGFGISEHYLEGLL